MRLEEKFRMGRTLTIASQKGGVGKTTTAVNLSATLCLGGKTVLLMDLDPQGNASSGVGFHRPPPPGGARSLQNRNIFLQTIMDGESLAPFISSTSFENLSVMPATPELSELEIIKEIQDSALPKLRKQVSALAEKYDYILIDCPPSLGGLPTIALSVSDSVLIPIQCEYYAMEGLSQIIPVIRELQKTSNPKLDIFGLLLTMYSDELELSRDVVEEVQGYFHELVFQTLIPRDVVLAEAASHGTPAFHYDPVSRGAWSYIELAKEVLAYERS
jgi:chromosome partitioning protein